MSQFKDALPEISLSIEDEQRYNLARAIGLRQWHTDYTTRMSFEDYFAVHRERLLRDADSSSTESSVG